MKYPRVFRPPLWLAVFLLVTAVALALLLTVLNIARTPWAWILMPLAVLAALAAIEGCQSKVVLTESDLEITSKFRKRRFPRSGFESVQWAYGCPVSLRLRSGGQLTLPSTMDSSKVAPAIKAWLRQIK